MRSQRSIASYGSTLALTGLTLVLALFTTPARLEWLGADAMGLYRVISDVLGYLGLLEVGMAAALASLFATSLARGDERRVRVLLRLGLNSLAKASGLKVLVGGAVCVGLVLVLDVPVQLRTDFVIGCGVGLASVLFTPVNAFRALLEGGQRSYTVQLLLSVQATLSTVLSVWFAALGWGVTGQFVALACGMAVGQTLLVAASLRRFPGVLRDPGADGNPSAGLRRLSGPAFVVQLTGTIAVLSDSIIIALFVSPSLVTAFFLTQRLASVAQSQLQSVGNASWAALAEIYAQGDLTLFNQRALELTRLVAIASCALLIPAAVFNRAFIMLWVGEDQYGGTIVSGAAALVAFGQAVISLWGFLFYAAGLLPRVVPVSVTIVAVNLAASIFLARTYGMVGPLLGTLVSFAAVGFWWYPLLMRRTFGLSPLGLAGALARPVALGMPVMAVAIWASQVPFFHSWAGWFAGSSGTSLGYLSLAWRIALSDEERRAWRQRLVTGLARVRR